MKTKHYFCYFLLFLIVACSQGDKSESIFPKGIDLQPGDIVLRCGTGLESHAVRFADQGGVYSHIGIVVDSAGSKMIVHAVPGEPDFEGDEDRVKMERPEKFFCSINASRGEILRTDDSIAATAAANRAMSFYKRRVLFDHDYDDNDTTLLYCTELVLLAYKDAGDLFRNIEHHEVIVPGIKHLVVYPSDVKSEKRLKSISIF